MVQCSLSANSAILSTCNYCNAPARHESLRALSGKVRERVIGLRIGFPCCNSCFNRIVSGGTVSSNLSAASLFAGTTGQFKGEVMIAVEKLNIPRCRELAARIPQLWKDYGVIESLLQTDMDSVPTGKYKEITLQRFFKRAKQINASRVRLNDSTMMLSAVVPVDYAGYRSEANALLRNKTLRNSVFSRDGFRCLGCKALEDLTVDHIVPVSRGGSSDIGNLQTLCRSCNSKKGAMV